MGAILGNREGSKKFFVSYCQVYRFVLLISFNSSAENASPLNGAKTLPFVLSH